MEIVIQVLLYHLTFSVPLVSTVLKLSVHHVELREKMYKYTCSPAGICGGLRSTVQHHRIKIVNHTIKFCHIKSTYFWINRCEQNSVRFTQLKTTLFLMRRTFPTFISCGLVGVTLTSFSKAIQIFETPLLIRGFCFIPSLNRSTR